MTKMWYSSKELILIEGLPSTIQGINRKARTEGWQSRKRSGIQGKALEYHRDSLPDFVKSHFMPIQEPDVSYGPITAVEPLQLWVSAFLSLNNDEKELLSSWLMRNGVKELIHFAQEQDHDN